MALQKNDFVELEFTGRTRDGKIFDTNIKEEANNIGLEIEERPLIICLGQGMILPTIDEFLLGKEVGRYTLELAPEKAFGLRSREYVKTMPIKVFYEKKIEPKPGMVFNFDNILGRISAVSGGRVIVDFNNPMAGKEVIYELNAKKRIDDINEKVNLLMESWFRKKFEFAIENNQLKLKVEKKFSQIIGFFKDKFKDILNLELETIELEDKTEKKEEKSDETSA